MNGLHWAAAAGLRIATHIQMSRRLQTLLPNACHAMPVKTWRGVIQAGLRCSRDSGDGVLNSLWRHRKRAGPSIPRNVCEEQRLQPGEAALQLQMWVPGQEWLALSCGSG